MAIAFWFRLRWLGPLLRIAVKVEEPSRLFSRFISPMMEGGAPRRRNVSATPVCGIAFPALRATPCSLTRMHLLTRLSFFSSRQDAKNRTKKQWREKCYFLENPLRLGVSITNKKRPGESGALQEREMEEPQFLAKCSLPYFVAQSLQQK